MTKCLFSLPILRHNLLEEGDGVSSKCVESADLSAWRQSRLLKDAEKASRPGSALRVLRLAGLRPSIALSIVVEDVVLPVVEAVLVIPINLSLPGLSSLWFCAFVGDGLSVTMKEEKIVNPWRSLKPLSSPSEVDQLISLVDSHPIIWNIGLMTLRALYYLVLLLRAAPWRTSSPLSNGPSTPPAFKRPRSKKQGRSKRRRHTQ